MTAARKPLVYVAGPITGDPWGCVRRAPCRPTVIRSELLDAGAPRNVVDEVVYLYGLVEGERDEYRGLLNELVQVVSPALKAKIVEVIGC